MNLSSASFILPYAPVFEMPKVMLAVRSTSRPEFTVETVLRELFSAQTEGATYPPAHPLHVPVIVTFPSNIVSPKTYSLLEGEAVPMPMLPDGSLKTAEEVREPDVFHLA